MAGLRSNGVPRPHPPAEPDLLSRIRAACLVLPEVTERPSHGAPSFFVRGGRAFLNAWLDGHHEHGFAHMWCAAPAGAQETLVRAEPGRFFRPPYVGHRGWIGVRLDAPIDDGLLAELAEDAYRSVAPARLVARLDAGG